MGAVLPGTARIEGGQGFAWLRLTSAPDAAPIVQRIMDGTVSAVSALDHGKGADPCKRTSCCAIWTATASCA